jgi:hypothetical protein
VQLAEACPGLFACQFQPNFSVKSRVLLGSCLDTTVAFALAFLLLVVFDGTVDEHRKNRRLTDFPLAIDTREYNQRAHHKRNVNYGRPY